MFIETELIEMENKQTTTIRLLVVALLVALVAIVALSFALCSRTTSGTAPAATQTASSSQQSPSDTSTPSSGAQTSSSWDEVTDDEPEPGASNGAASSSSEPASASPSGTSASAPDSKITVQEDGTYTSKDEVALYIHTYGHLPSNFVNKTKAKKAGWVAKKGNLDEVLPGMSIGGSEFYNNEGQLPDAKGRTWTECDINYTGGYRGAERIVFSNDGLIFYTADHYKTFEQLY